MISFRLPLALILLPAFGSAQSPDATANQKMIEELKGVRESLAKLEKGQKALVALARIQIDESRLTVLEAQRLQLLSQEQSLQKEIADAAPALRSERPAVTPTLLQVGPDGSQEVVQKTTPSPVAARAAESSTKLEEVRRNRQAIEQTIGALNQRIAAWEKQVDDALR